MSWWRWFGGGEVELVGEPWPPGCDCVPRPVRHRLVLRTSSRQLVYEMDPDEAHRTKAHIRNKQFGLGYPGEFVIDPQLEFRTADGAVVNVDVAAIAVIELEAVRPPNLPGCACDPLAGLCDYHLEEQRNG